MMKKSVPNFRPEWRLLPAPPIGNSAPVANDYIMDLLASNTVVSVTGVRRFTNDNDIELDDGTTITADAVVFCTGYRYDFSIMSPEADPSATSTPEWEASRHNNGLRYPRLYQGMLSPKFPESLAFVGAWRGHSFAAFSNADLSGQAIAQIWKGGYTLPSQQEIDKWCDEHYKQSLKQISVYSLVKVGHPPGDLERWLNDVTGNGINEKLGWGWEGWKFWWSEHKLYKILMDGIDTSYIYRLFDGRRQKWEGAREAIYKTNGKPLNKP